MKKIKKVKKDTNIKVKVEETNDECKITIIDKLYNERQKKVLSTSYLQRCQNNQKLVED